MEHTTLLLIKPNATAKNKIGEIIKMVEDHGFVIDRLKIFRFDTELGRQFYAIHAEKPFFSRLIDFMTSGKTVAVVVHRDNAVAFLRKLVGNTDHTQAAPGTIRHLYGESITMNAVHASDSPENAVREIGLIFPEESK
ncbi:MAG: nucleoside-diphosphate kinase [Candidatus Cloacimonetes bacterium]|nr:nucleoside-diphosphate kinase [Candidatus Cloacimonadota bacterium]